MHSPKNLDIDTPGSDRIMVYEFYQKFSDILLSGRENCESYEDEEVSIRVPRYILMSKYNALYFSYLKQWMWSSI